MLCAQPDMLSVITLIVLTKYFSTMNNCCEDVQDWRSILVDTYGERLVPGDAGSG